MQNSLNKEGNIVEFTSNKTGVTTDIMKGSATPNKEFISQVAQLKAEGIEVIDGRVDLKKYGM